MEYAGNDFYCDIALKDTSLLQKEYESDTVLAYHHTRPSWPIHIVVVPKIHIPSFTDSDVADNAVISELLNVTRMIAKKIEFEHGAARIMTNVGDYQDSKHLHIHVHSGEPLR